MLALHIPDVKSFMSMLLLRDTFDAFLLKEADITTFVTHTIDGLLHPAFFDDASFKDDYVSWRDVKGYCYSVIKGKRTPLHFRFVFRLNRANTEKFLSQNRLDVDPEDVAGLYLNCQFDGERLICTTGTALTFFSLDRVLDHLWDDMVERIFQKNKIFFVQS